MLAEKSRENSELQTTLAEKTAEFEKQLADLQLLNESISEEKNDLEEQLTDKVGVLETKLNKEIEVSNFLLFFLPSI